MIMVKLFDKFGNTADKYHRDWFYSFIINNVTNTLCNHDVDKAQALYPQDIKKLYNICQGRAVIEIFEVNTLKDIVNKLSHPLTCIFLKVSQSFRIDELLSLKDIDYYLVTLEVNNSSISTFQAGLVYPLQ